MTAGTPEQTLPRVSVEHIVLDERGRAHLAGHRIRVSDLIRWQQAERATAEQLQADAYPHLSLSQIHAALAYYYDHQEEIERQLGEENECDQRERERLHRDPRLQDLSATMEARRRQRDGR